MVGGGWLLPAPLDCGDAGSVSIRYPPAGFAQDPAGRSRSGSSRTIPVSEGFPLLAQKCPTRTWRAVPPPPPPPAVPRENHVNITGLSSPPLGDQSEGEAAPNHMPARGPLD
eukprot:scaffold2663_cov353-Prasinococcus_capsulatus_cf.AAC.5